MRPVTLCFLSRGAGDAGEVCLGWKKTGFGAGKWAGIGGKVDEANGETVTEAARRELREEVLVDAEDLTKVAELTFFFPHEPDWNMEAHVYMVRAWRGVPTETDEMRPHWFGRCEIPYAAMWDDAQYWLPRLLAGERLQASFTYAPGNRVADRSIKMLQPAGEAASPGGDWSAT